ncbi:MAG: hypothetical protein Q8S84_02070 [bacterium]|nr:hypothetical protein [bacterium]MDP3380342.1 hypothetical protein [bacterium]
MFEKNTSFIVLYHHLPINNSEFIILFDKLLSNCEIFMNSGILKLAVNSS